MKELSLNVAHAAFRGSSRSGRMAHVKMNENMMTMMMIRLRAVWTIALVPFVVNALDATSLSEVPAVALGSGVTSPSEPLEGPTDWESKLSAGLVYKSGNTDSERMTLGLATEKFAGQTLLRAYANGTYETAEVEDEEGRRVTDRTVGDAKAGANLKRRIDGYFVFADVWVFHDDMADVRYRAVESAGGQPAGDGRRDAPEPRHHGPSDQGRCRYAGGGLRFAERADGTDQRRGAEFVVLHRFGRGGDRGDDGEHRPHL